MFTLKSPLLLMAFLGVMLASCHTCPDATICPPEGYRLVKTEIPEVTTIDTATAVNWTSKWRAKMGADGGFLEHDPVKAFIIPHQDLTGVLSNHQRARAYLAYQDTLGEKQYHLVIVGIDSLGNDDLSAIYDLTTPCPRACDTGSLLNGN